MEKLAHLYLSREGYFVYGDRVQDLDSVPTDIPLLFLSNNGLYSVTYSNKRVKTIGEYYYLIATESVSIPNVPKIVMPIVEKVDGLAVLKSIGYDNDYITKTELWIAEELYKKYNKGRIPYAVKYTGVKNDILIITEFITL